MELVSQAVPNDEIMLVSQAVQFGVGFTSRTVWCWLHKPFSLVLVSQAVQFDVGFTSRTVWCWLHKPHSLELTSQAAQFGVDFTSRTVWSWLHKPHSLELTSQAVQFGVPLTASSAPPWRKAAARPLRARRVAGVSADADHQRRRPPRQPAVVVVVTMGPCGSGTSLSAALKAAGARPHTNGAASTAGV